MKAGWEVKRLGEVCEIIKGRKPKLKLRQADGDLPYLVAKVMRGTKEAEFASINDRNSVVVLDSDTIIICDGSNSGEIFTGFYGILSSTMGKIAKIIDLNDNYLRAYLSSTFEVFNGSKTGAAIPHLDKEAMYQLPIPLPPLPEQERIVGILDEAFAGIAAAKANAEKNLQNARALFESYLNAVFSHRGEGWGETTVGEQVDFLAGFAFKSSKYTQDPDGVRLIRGDNIVQGKFRWEGVKRWPKEDANDYKNFTFEVDDIVLAMDRPWVTAGLKIAYVSSEDLPALQVQRTARLRSKKSLNWKFLFHLLRSQDFVIYLLDGQTGLGVPHISGKQILSFRFGLPPLNEQKAIASKLDSLQTETRRLAAIYERKLEALEALKKSLLHQAFTGNL